MWLDCRNKALSPGLESAAKGCRWGCRMTLLPFQRECASDGLEKVKLVAIMEY